MDDRERDATARTLDEPAGVPDPRAEDNITVRTTRRQELLDQLAQEPEISIQPPEDNEAGSANRVAYEADLQERQRLEQEPGAGA